MTIMTIENAEEVLMDRLVDFHKEIPGLTRVYRHMPSISPDAGDLPFVFFSIREMPSAIPTTNDSHASTAMTRRVIAHFCSEPFAMLSEDSGDLGWGAYNRTVPWLGVFRGAYLRRGDLRIQGGIHPDVPDPQRPLNTFYLTFRDSGIISREVGDTDYFAIDWVLDIPLDLIH